MIKKKIIIYGKHFAEIDQNFYLHFIKLTDIKNFNGWIREQVLIDFHIDIKSSTDIEKIDELFLKNFYHNKREWLTEKMRNKMKQIEYMRKGENEVICYRFKDKDGRFVNSPTLTKDFLDAFIKSKSILARCEKKYLGLEDVGGYVPEVLVRFMLSFEIPMKNVYMTHEEYDSIKRMLQGTEYEKCLESFKN